MPNMQINRIATIMFAITLCLPLANAITINIRDSTTGAYLNSTINITYNQYQSYQEQANVATSTGGVATGTYSSEEIVATNAYLYTNYTKTAVANNFTWQTKYGVNTAGDAQNLTNYTLPTACWNSNPNTVQLRFYTAAGQASGSSYGQCYNSTEWVNVTNISICGSSSLGAGTNVATATKWNDTLYTGDGNMYYLSGLNTFRQYPVGDVVGSCPSASFLAFYAGIVTEEGAYWTHPYQQILQTAPSGTTTLTNGTYYLIANVTVSAGGYGSITLNNLDLTLSAYTFNLTTTNNVTFRVLDEITGAVINTTDIRLSSALNGSNKTTVAGTATFYNLTYSLYTITYNASGYSQRTYLILLPSTSSETINLFLLPTGDATTVRFTVADTTNFRLTNATVYINKKNASGTNYYLVATCTTDTNGQCVSNVNIIDTTYKFLVYYNGAFRADSLDTVVTSTEVPITVSLIGDPLDEFFMLPRVSTGLTYAAGTATWTVADSSGNVQSGCVRVYRRTGFIVTQLNGTCTTGASFTISAYANNSLGDENYAIGTVYVNGLQYQVTRESEDNNDLANSNNPGLLLLAVVFAVGITLAFKYAWDMTTSLVMFMVSTILFWSVGMIQLSSLAIISVIILLLAFMLRNKQ